MSGKQRYGRDLATNRAKRAVGRTPEPFGEQDAVAASSHKLTSACDDLATKAADDTARNLAPVATADVLLATAALRQRFDAVRARLEHLGAPCQRVELATLRPMLCQTASAPFSGPGWIFELKYDGYRLLAAAGNGQARLRYRSGLDATALFPELTQALAAWPCAGLVLDGEVVAFDDSGRPAFRCLHARAQLRRPVAIERAALRQPVCLMAFDLLALEGRDLRPLPLWVRKSLLQQLLPSTGPVRFADHVAERGEELFTEVARRGLEGMVAKRADAPYRGTRSSHWLKVRLARSDASAVADNTAHAVSAPPGQNPGLHTVTADRAATPSRARGGRGQVRQVRSLGSMQPMATRTNAPSSPAGHDMVPTMYDLETFYRGIAPWLLPYLRDRPLMLAHHPAENPGRALPAGLRSEVLWSRHARREMRCLVCESEHGLAALASLGVMPFHIWSARVSTLSRPDWTLLDLVPGLVPGRAPAARVITVARAVNDLCCALELPSFVKTSGTSGLQILIPLGGLCTYAQSRALAQLLAKVVEAEHPDIATTARRRDQQLDRVHIDFHQNGHGRVLLAPFAVQPVPGIPVSMPLAWDEIEHTLEVLRFTMATAVQRMHQRGLDPMTDLLATRPDLPRVLALLDERLRRSG